MGNLFPGDKFLVFFSHPLLSKETQGIASHLQSNKIEITALNLRTILLIFTTSSSFFSVEMVDTMNQMSVWEYPGFSTVRGTKGDSKACKPRCRSDRGCCGGKIKCPSGFERLRKKSFPETFCATGPLEAPGLSSQVAMQTLYYTGRDKGDQETPLVSEATSATGIYAPSQPIFVILFIANIHYLIPSQELI